MDARAETTPPVIKILIIIRTGSKVFNKLLSINHSSECSSVVPGKFQTLMKSLRHICLQAYKKMASSARWILAIIDSLFRRVVLPLALISGSHSNVPLPAETLKGVLFGERERVCIEGSRESVWWGWLKDHWSTRSWSVCISSIAPTPLVQTEAFKGEIWVLAMLAAEVSKWSGPCLLVLAGFIDSKEGV